jgi:hypothetical protein
VPSCSHQPLAAVSGCTPHLTCVAWLLKRVLFSMGSLLYLHWLCHGMLHDAAPLSLHTGGSRRSAGAAVEFALAQRDLNCEPCCTSYCIPSFFCLWKPLTFLPCLVSNNVLPDLIIQVPAASPWYEVLGCAQRTG